MSRIRVEVFRRGPCLRGEELAGEIKELGIKENYSVEVSKIYILEFDGDLLPESPGERAKKIAEEILTDPVVEEYSPEIRKKDGISVEVYFKKGVLDITARRVLEASCWAGLSEGVESVSTGERYLINSPWADMETCRYISQKLFYNKVIQRAVYG